MVPSSVLGGCQIACRWHGEMSEGYQSQQASIFNYHSPAEETKGSSHSIVNSIGARDRILPSGPRALILAKITTSLGSSWLKSSKIGSVKNAPVADKLIVIPLDF